MRIYLDSCCLSRPFDDQSQSRVRVEVAAVEAIIERCERGDFVWVTSDIVEVEVRRDPLFERRARKLASLETAGERVGAGDPAFARAAELQAFGLRPIDALHVALAERSACDALLTTDDQFIRAAGRITPPLAFRILNPLQWLQENPT